MKKVIHNRSTGGKRKGAGRPREIDRPTRIVAILPETQVRWLSDQPEGQSGTVRRLVGNAMKS